MIQEWADRELLDQRFERPFTAPLRPFHPLHLQLMTLHVPERWKVSGWLHPEQLVDDTFGGSTADAFGALAAVFFGVAADLDGMSSSR